MKFKDLINSFITYKPKESHHFLLTENIDITNNHKEINENNNNNNENINKEHKIFTSLNKNLEYMKIKYNTLINSDIVLRKFTLNIRGKQYDSFIIYIDGMVDSKIMNEFILEPLMMRNKNNLYNGDQNKVISESTTNNVTIRKIKKFDLTNYLIGCLLPQNSVKTIENFEKSCSAINSR